MHSASIPVRRQLPALRHSRRLLGLAGDERLVAEIRRGNEAAFEVVFERYGAPVLAFCRHMLGSREEAEDAVQHTFAAAHRQLLRDERAIALKPWLYTIARHRCLSLLRARREQPLPLVELPIDGLSERVEQRAELRELLADLRDLPAEQRAALLLTEVGDLSHAEVATVLECEVARVKALVFRARSGLIARREARALPCERVREQLATLRGGALRRLELKHHLHACPGCRAYRQEIKRQRELLGAALPVVPSLGLKASVLGALGIGGGSAGGGGAVAAGGLAGAASLGGAGAAKLAAVAVLATGAVAGERALLERDGPAPPAPAAHVVQEDGLATKAVAAPASRPPGSSIQGRRDRPGPAAGPRGTGRARKTDPASAALAVTERSAGVAGARSGRPAAPPGQAKRAERSDGAPVVVPPGQAKRTERPGRGPIEAPPRETPVKRGPPVGRGQNPDAGAEPGPPADPPGSGPATPAPGPPATPPGHAESPPGHQ